MNYIQMDYTQIQGFTKLTQDQQELFIETYKLHNSIVGTAYKDGWKPIKVKWVVENPSQYSYLRVDFANGNWLHYTQRKEWY